MKDWRIWLIIILLVAVVFLSWKSCRGKNDSEVVKRGDSAAAQVPGIIKMKDSIISTLNWQKDSVDALKIGLEEANQMLTEMSLFNERKIKLLTGILNTKRTDTVVTAYTETCDSLAVYANEQVRLTEEARYQYRQLDTLARYEVAIRDTAIEQLEIAHASLVDAFNVVRGSFNALKPRTEFYIGGTGVYNPAVWGAGGSLLLKTKKDKIYQASYIITNNKPMYQVGAAFKINLR